MRAWRARRNLFQSLAAGDDLWKEEHASYYIKPSGSSSSISDVSWVTQCCPCCPFGRWWSGGKEGVDLLLCASPLITSGWVDLGCQNSGRPRPTYSKLLVSVIQKPQPMPGDPPRVPMVPLPATSSENVPLRLEPAPLVEGLKQPSPAALHFGEPPGGSLLGWRLWVQTLEDGSIARRGRFRGKIMDEEFAGRRG